MNKLDSTHLFLDQGIDPLGRTISLLGPIDFSAADRVISGLYLLKGGKPINLLIHSEGGDDDHCRAIIAAMLAHRAPIHGHVIGIAESAAAWILQHCDKRTMYPHSSLMFHMGESPKNKHNRHVDKMFVDDVLARIQERIPDYLRTKLVSNMDSDWFVYPTQAVELGLADEVITCP